MKNKKLKSNEIMHFGVMNDPPQKAYWLQIWKVRCGVFIWPKAAWTSFGFSTIRKREFLGWILCCGPFQLAYYRNALSVNKLTGEVKMSHIVSFDDGEILDLNTKTGAYKNVARFLRENGASNDIFCSLGKLFPKGIDTKVFFDGQNIPLEDAVNILTDDEILRGQYADQTVIDLREAIKGLIQL